VEQPVDTDLDDGDVVNLGTLGLNVLVPTVFTIRNAGGQNLTLSNVTVTGTHASQFSIIDQPTLTVAPLDSTTFTVQARVTSAGAKTARHKARVEVDCGCQPRPSVGIAHQTGRASRDRENLRGAQERRL
jgi:hypothetical protein